jgi:AraC-like DNA-binding protein
MPMASGRGFRFVVAYLRGRGVDVDPVLRGAGIDVAVVADPEARLPTPAIARFFAAAVHAAGDPNLGLHAAASVRPEFLGELGYLLRASRTLGDGMRRIGRYQRFISDRLNITAGLDGARAFVGVVFEGHGGDSRQEAEFAVRTLLVLGRHETGVDFTPVAVEFAHAAPADPSEHERVFGAPVRFARAHDRLVLTRAQFELPFRRADDGLCALLERRVREIVAALPSGENVSDQVRRLLASGFEAGQSGASPIGRSLGLSVRTLHRKLQAEGTSLSALRDEVRQDLARMYLSERLPISEVAFLLGYSEASAFHRSFKRWTGVTPVQYVSPNP